MLEKLKPVQGSKKNDRTQARDGLRAARVAVREAIDVTNDEDRKATPAKLDRLIAEAIGWLEAVRSRLDVAERWK